MNTITTNTIEAIDTIEEANTIEEEKKLREAINVQREDEAKKTLRASLLALLARDGEAFLRILPVSEPKNGKRRFLPFVKEYEGIEAETGEAVTMKTKLSFSIFNRYDNAEEDTNEARKYKSSMREAIREAVKRIALLASDTPSKEDASEALTGIAEAVRLLGFGKLSEALNASDAKRILRSAYTIDAEGEDDSIDGEVKKAIQAVMRRIVTGRDSANARREREAKKEAEAEAKKREREDAKREREALRKELEDAKRERDEAKAKLSEANAKLSEVKTKTAKPKTKTAKTEAK